IYNALLSLRQDDMTGLSETLHKARVDVMDALGHESFESYRSIYPQLTYLQILSDIETSSSIKWKNPQSQNRFSQVSLQTNSLGDVLDKWNDNAKIMMSNPDLFEFSELLQSARAMVLDITDKDSDIEQYQTFWT